MPRGSTRTHVGRPDRCRRKSPSPPASERTVVAARGHIRQDLLLGIVMMLWSSVLSARCADRFQDIAVLACVLDAVADLEGRSNMIVIPAMNAATRSRIAKPTANATRRRLPRALGSRRMFSPRRRRPSPGGQHEADGGSIFWIVGRRLAKEPQSGSATFSTSRRIIGSGR